MPVQILSYPIPASSETPENSISTAHFEGHGTSPLPEPGNEPFNLTDDELRAEWESNT
jgi:hypothetical protein